MARAATPTDARPDAQCWRVRYHVGDLEHYTAWSTDFATVENLYEQYRRGEYAHDVVIECPTAVRSK
jgi:hypothetical protein